ncbi:dihydrolipoamide dehydrogenase [Candidatus Magnetoovum chiemensis]|nr:dihydrolipoamide dehydrogenase [Candidatus Magnetoovum chiemensis]
MKITVIGAGPGGYVAALKAAQMSGEVSAIEADKLIIATGSRPANIPAFPFDGKHIISSTDALELQELPKSIIIIGAGVIGCEFACIFKEFGTDVTMIELMPRALSTEDEEIADIIEKEFKKKKIKLFTNVSADKVTVEPGKVQVALSNGKEASAEKLLVSIGRAFNTDGLGLDKAGINTRKRGDIEVNEYMQTSNPDVYAIGDVTGGILLAHVASKEGIVAVNNIMGHKEAMDYSVVPAGVFTHPEIGSVGLREHEAKNKGINYKTGHFQYRALGKSHAVGEITGIFKIISDPSTDKILGAHIVGHQAADLIHEAAIAMKAGLTVKDIAETIHSHPTLSEGMLEAAEDVHGNAIHAPKK